MTSSTLLARIQLPSRGLGLQPSHPELLDALADYFRKNNYSLHKLFSLICNSSAYQLSARFPGEWSENYTKYYARKYARMLTAEELHDAIATATDRPGSLREAVTKEPRFAHGDADQRAPRVGRIEELHAGVWTIQSRSSRAPAGASPLQPIMLMRSPVVNDRVLAAKDSRVQRLLAPIRITAKLWTSSFLPRCLASRKPEERGDCCVAAWTRIAWKAPRMCNGRCLTWLSFSTISESEIMTQRIRRDLVPSRRELLKFGGLGLVGASADAIWPLQFSADHRHRRRPRAAPRGMWSSSRFRGLSHIDTFDFKENPATQKDFDVRKTSDRYLCSEFLFPRMVKVMDRIAIVRSFVSHEEVHLARAVLLAGRPAFERGFCAEIPSVGSWSPVSSNRSAGSTDTFPTYVSFNLETNQVGALSTGFLPPRFSVFD